LANGDRGELGAATPQGVGGGGVLIVGYGNALRTDDGLGWHAAARLSDDPRLRGTQVLWQHQLAPELAVDVSKASLVILIDVSVEEEPGAISVRRLDAAGGGPDAGSAWSHHVEPGALVALARKLWGASPPVFVVSVGAASLDVGDRLSPAVEAALPGVVEAVVEIVAEHSGPTRLGHV
jgi:hydrogenase maturation protease